MDADQTYNSIVFKKNYDTASESLRRSTARGINTPDDMIIKSQSYIDSATKVAGTRYLIRLDLHEVDANNVPIVISAQVVLAIPSTADTADVTTLVATLRAVVADADHLEDVLNGEK